MQGSVEAATYEQTEDSKRGSFALSGKYVFTICTEFPALSPLFEKGVLLLVHTIYIQQSYNPQWMIL